MLKQAGTKKLKKVVILNPKGGSGKTTLAFGIAGYLAGTGRAVALLDMDRQGSSQRWLQNRPAKLPNIRALSATADPAETIRVPSDIDVVVIDAPAALSGEELIEYTCGAHAILVPVLPSDIDIHAASRLVSDLLLKAHVSRRNGRLGIVANRVKERTVAYRQLLRFLESLTIKLIGVLRDSQNYAHAAAEGRCLHEMAASQVNKDMVQWKAITDWLEDRLARPLTPRDLLRPASARDPKRRAVGMVLPLAAAIGGLTIASWFFAGKNVTPVSEPPAPLDSADVFASTPIQPIERYTEVEAAVEDSEPESRWRLAGVVTGNGERVLVLNDDRDNTTVHLGVDGELDGWSVTESGNDYAVLRQGDQEVHLALNEIRAQ